MSKQAAVLRFTGVVQGVGFRPLVYRIATEMDLTGWVLNTATGVTIHAEGQNLPNFYQRILAELPPLAKVFEHSLNAAKVHGYKTFAIKPSLAQEEKQVILSPDVATCAACLTEVFTPGARREGYAFTNCTNCGPRYTIISDVPYDRPKTTMGRFPMCPDCAAEYHNPADRRFHAQPIACPECGPSLVLVDGSGHKLNGIGLDQLKMGNILAVKGLGGFHLVCNALDKEAVDRLRHRKRRKAKPLAVMAKNIAVVRRYCHVSALEEQLLTSAAAPIVILQTKDDLAALGLPETLAPGLDTMGVMLPYTPLHHLLLADGLDLLVMTSANLSGEPLIYRNDTALSKLAGICDYWLLHNREIYHPCDDSLVRVIHNRPVYLRRARGYVPLPLDLGKRFVPAVGLGGDLKNTFCLIKQNKAFVSQHGGDLSHYESFQQFKHELGSLQRVTACSPQIVGYDLHPEYTSSNYARNIKDVRAIAVQHHHAHMAACLAENRIGDTVLGVICDGTGYGLDGAIWGFEFLWGDTRNFHRVGHLEYLPLPGGDSASRKPDRIAMAYLIYLLGYCDSFRTYLPGLTPEEVDTLVQQVKRGFNTFPTSSCGRLFDAVSALTGICSRVSYEGQAAIELEAHIKSGSTGSYPFDLQTVGTELIIRVRPLLSALIQDLAAGNATDLISTKFHNTVAEMILAVLRRLRTKLGVSKTVISGGVFQNKYLTEYLVPRLENAGFTVYQHRELPPGDGGLSLGQAVVASEVSKDCVSQFLPR